MLLTDQLTGEDAGVATASKNHGQPSFEIKMQERIAGGVIYMDCRLHTSPLEMKYNVGG